MKFGNFARKLAKFAIYGVLGLVLLGGILVTLAGVGMQIPAAQTEVTDRQPFADYIGREYRVIGDVTALAWNDFPDKDTILTISLMSPPLVRNRFVSYSKPLRPWQAVRIVSAGRSLVLDGYSYQYRVLLPGSGLPEDVVITMDVNADGVPDPGVYASIER